MCIQFFWENMFFIWIVWFLLCFVKCRSNVDSLDSFQDWFKCSKWHQISEVLSHPVIRVNFKLEYPEQVCCASWVTAVTNNTKKAQCTQGPLNVLCGDHVCFLPDEYELKTPYILLHAECFLSIAGLHRHIWTKNVYKIRQ